jgi:hypothetical protein
MADEGAVSGFRDACTCRRAQPSAARVVAMGKGGTVARVAARALTGLLRCDHAVAKCSYPWGMRADRAVGAEVLRVLKPLGVHARLGRSKRWRSRRRLAADSWNWRLQRRASKPHMHAGNTMLRIPRIVWSPASSTCSASFHRRSSSESRAERLDREPVRHGNIRGAHDALESAARVKQAP